MAIAAALVLLTMSSARLAVTRSSSQFTAVGQNTNDSFTSDALDPPTSLAAVGGSNVSLSWTPTVDTYATGHNIYRATSSGGPYTLIAQVTPRATAVWVDGPSTGTYYYRASAYYLTWESAYSNQVSAAVVTSPTFDSSSSTSGTATTQSWTHTVGSGNNRILIVTTGSQNVNANTVTFNGVALTLIGRQIDGGGATRISMWYLLSPATGAGTIQVTYASGSDAKVMGASSWSNVNQASPIGTFGSQSGSSGTTASVAVTSATNEIVVDAVSYEGLGSLTASAPQVERWNVGLIDVVGGHSSKAGASSVTMSWTIPSSPWAIGAVSLKS